jgi:hypothetical protein
MIILNNRFKALDFLGYKTETMSTEEAYKFACQLSQNGFDFFAYSDNVIKVNFRTKSQLKKHDEFLKFQNIWYKFA